MMKFLMTLVFMAQAAPPQEFRYSGSLQDASGNVPSEPVTLRLQIFNGAANCLLYEEEQSLNPAVTGGEFSVLVGSPVSSTKRSAGDRGLTMDQVFSNGHTVPAGTGCTNGFTPTPEEVRKLRISVIGANGTDVLTPDQIIAAVPYANQAYALQGLLPGDFVQIPASIPTMQAELEAMVQGASTTYALADGSNFNPTGTLSLTNGAQVTTAPVGDNDVTNKKYVDENLGGNPVDLTSGLTDNQTLIWDATNSVWKAGNPPAPTGITSLGAGAQVPGPPTANNHVTNKEYVDTKLAGSTVDLAGLAANQTLIWDATNSVWKAGNPPAPTGITSLGAGAQVPGPPTANNHVTNKEYVDTKVAGGASNHVGVPTNVPLSAASAKNLYINFNAPGGSVTLPDPAGFGDDGHTFRLIADGQPISINDSSSGFLG